ncbi:MAG TPA: SO2930 family diheme c-type cytochrome [Rhizobacter sp.]|nr:SO2930 family diheme c-type cytochrome [Rhizobacter sp.]
MKRILCWSLSVAVAAALVACGGGGGGGSAPSDNGTPVTGPQVFTLANAPTKLSAWKMFNLAADSVSLASPLVPYDLNSALFSDYAFKLRAIYVPAGQKITYNATGGILDFPVGSVLVKTFYYPKATASGALPAVAQQTQTAQGSSVNLASNRLVETRFLVRKSDGSWEGIPYVWDADQRDATLTPEGQYTQMELVDGSTTPATSQNFTYVVPNSQTCQNCHATSTHGSGSTDPIGPKVRNLNKSYDYGNGVVKNQLVQLKDLGLLAGFDGAAAAAPLGVDWKDTNQTLSARAAAYMDVNCGHCHNGSAGAGQAGGYASQSGLLLSLGDFQSAQPVTWGVCKLPLAYVGTGQPGYKYDITPGSANSSILLYRMSHVGAGQTMPVFGRQTNHVEALDLITRWIDGLTTASPTGAGLAACP